tara:strand:+ start:927 stop:1193 length:267 start_codon:yes stop_codon:yes gene_type:complete
MAKLKLLAAAANAGTNAGAGAAFDGATVVYCLNANAAAQLVTVCNASNTTQGSFHLGAGASHMVIKKPTDKVFAASADVKLTPVAHHA